MNAHTPLNTSTDAGTHRRKDGGAHTHTHLLCNTVHILGPKKNPLADVSMQTSDLSPEVPRAVHVYALCQTVRAHTVRVFASEFPPLDMHNYVQKKSPQ